jgi:ketosteroid isomerase-like protein
MVSLHGVTEDDIRILLDGYEALNRRDFGVLTDVLDPELEWEPGAVTPEGGAHRGAEGFRGFLDSWLESFDEFRVTPELVVQAGDTAVVVAHQQGRGHGSGIAIDARVTHMWTIRDSTAVGWRAVRSLDEALSALGDERPALALRGYEAFNRGDLEEAVSLFDPEIVWQTYLVPGPGGGTYHGHGGVRELWADARNVFGDFRNEPERLVSAGERVVAFIRVCGWGKESGVAVEAKIAHLLTFRGDKVVRVASYEDRDEALREAGLH